MLFSCFNHEIQYVHLTQIPKPEILDNKDIPVGMKALHCIGEFTWEKKNAWGDSWSDNSKLRYVIPVNVYTNFTNNHLPLNVENSVHDTDGQKNR